MTAVAPLGRGFYGRAAALCAADLLGAVVVHRSPVGAAACMVTEVEVAPPGECVSPAGPGHAVVQGAFGTWHKLAVSTGPADDDPSGPCGAVVVRAGRPLGDVRLMMQRWKPAVDEARLCEAPGKLCRSLGLALRHDGTDLCEGDLVLVQVGVVVDPALVVTEGGQDGAPLRLGVDAAGVEALVAAAVLDGLGLDGPVAPEELSPDGEPTPV